MPYYRPQIHLRRATFMDGYGSGAAPAPPVILVTPTLSLNATTQALSVTNDGDQPVGTPYQWQQTADGASWSDVSGETGLSFSMPDTGLSWRVVPGGDAAKASAAYVRMVDKTIYDADFATDDSGTIPNNTPWTSTTNNGITPTGDAAYKVSGGELVVDAASGSVGFSLPNEALKITLGLKPTKGDGTWDASPDIKFFSMSGSPWHEIRFLYSPGGGSFNVWVDGNGAGPSFFSTGYNEIVSDKDADITIQQVGSNWYLQYQQEGSAPAWSDNGGLGKDITTFWGAKGTNFFIGTSGGSFATRNHLLRSLRFASASADFNVTNVAVNGPTLAASAAVSADFDYVGAGSPSGLKARLVASDGRELSDWVNVEITDTTLTIPFAVDAYGEQGCAIQFTDDDSSTHYDTVSAGDIPFYYPVTTPIMGHQASNMAPWSPEGDIWTNRENATDWKGFRETTLDPGEDPWKEITDWTIDGHPTGVLPDRATCLVAKIWEGGMVGFERGGTYTISWEMTNVTASWQSYSNATVGAIDNVAKTATITFADFATPGGMLKFVPTGGATGNWRFTAIRNGETATGPINDKAINDYIPGTILRWVKAQASEWPYPTWPTAPYLRDSRWAPPETIGQVSVQTDTYPHIVLPGNVNDDWLTDFATRLKANIDPGRPIRVEYINEPWNIFYWQSVSFAVVGALNDGMVSGVTAGGGWQNYLYPAGVVDRTGLVYQTIPSGTKFLCQTNFHWVAMEATGTINPGDYIPDQQTPGWTGGNVIVRAGYDELWTGKDIWRARRVGQIGDIFNDVFDGQNPILPVLGLWKSYTVEHILQMLTAGGAGTEYGRKIKRIHATHYIDLNYDWGDAPSWMTGYADQTAFNAGLDGVVASGLTTTIGQLSYQMHGCYAGLKTLGWADADIALYGTYEGDLTHLVVDNVPSGDQAGLAAAMNAWREAPATYTNTFNGLTAIRNLGFHDMTSFGMNDYPKPGSTIEIFGFQKAVYAWASPSIGANQRRMNAWRAVAGA